MEKKKPNLSVKLAGMIMKNPVMNAAGTFELNDASRELMKPQKLGAIVSKSINLKGKIGNPQPRICEVYGGLINCIGLQNSGVINFIEEKIFSLAEIGVPIIVSIFGKSIDEFYEINLILRKRAHLISALELNVSCPNIKDGIIFGSKPKLLFKLVSSLKKETDFPLIVKLTPNVTDIAECARAAADAGASAISLINTVKARDFIPPGLDGDQWIEGGLSGPAIRPIALQKVWEVSRTVNLPLIAMGGISNTQDALTFLRIKNVRAIAVGTATFRNPSAMVQIIEGLEKYFSKKGYANFNEFAEKEKI